MIGIIDYGAGNLRSVVNAVTRLGYLPRVTSNSDELLAAQAVILPGVGTAGDTMSGLRQRGLIAPIRRLINENRPFLGICVGLQVLFTFSREGKGQECLDILPGEVKKFPEGMKIPHMGWNQVKQLKEHPLFTGIADNFNMYFVHSYYPEPADKTLTIGQTEYGRPFCSAVARGNLFGTQFHPEKSGEAGLKMYDNFFKIAGITTSE